MWLEESVKNEINDVDVICCADKQTIDADIKVTVDVDGCVESNSVRFLYQILLM